MKKLGFIWLLSVVGLVGTLAHAYGRWDASFIRVGAIASTAPTSASLDLSTFVNAAAPPYVKVQCDVAAYIGQGRTGGTCAATTCEKVAAGDKFFAQLSGGETHIHALSVSGAAACQVYIARN